MLTRGDFLLHRDEKAFFSDLYEKLCRAEMELDEAKGFCADTISVEGIAFWQNVIKGHLAAANAKRLAIFADFNADYQRGRFSNRETDSEVACFLSIWEKALLSSDDVAALPEGP